MRNTAVIGCRKSLFLKQTSKQLQSPTIVGSVKPSNRTSPFFEGGHGCPKLNAQSFAGRKTNRVFIKRQGCWRFATFCKTNKAFIKRYVWWCGARDSAVFMKGQCRCSCTGTLTKLLTTCRYGNGFKQCWRYISPGGL